MSCCDEAEKGMKDSGPGTTVEPAKQLTTDPVCGMKVDPAKAASAEYQGTKFYFCCQGCATKFQAEPAKYLQAKQSAAPLPPMSKQTPQTDYICPMHPEVHSSGPGNCPKCGMALEPATLAAPMSRTAYTCAMPPQIVRDQPC